MDDDKKYYGQSFNIVKRYVGMNQEEGPVEHMQLNQEDIKSLSGDLVPAFMELLGRKLSDIQNVIRTNTATAPGVPGAYTTNIGLVEDVINAYNKIISVILNPVNTPQTKEALMTSLMKCKSLIKGLENLCEHVLDRQARTLDENQIRPSFMLFLKAYNLYNYINKQLNTRSLILISDADLAINRRSVVTATWLHVATRFNLQYLNYLPIAPTGGPPGGGPPGSGPPPGPGGGPVSYTHLTLPTIYSV